MTDILTDKIGILKSEFDELSRNYNVARIGFFGSVTRDDFKKGSDIDVLVEFSEPIGFFKYLQLERHLKVLLKAEVDLVTLAALKPAIRESVFNDAVYV